MNNEAVIYENAILVRINKLYHDSMTQEELYEATRGVWKVGNRRDKAKYAFAVYRGKVKEVYKINNWFSAGTLSYNTRLRSDVGIQGRWEFDGSVAEIKIRNKYIGKSVKAYLPKGSAYPIVYINC